jgi:Fur family ferric uptake transcriptional regulator
MKNEIKEKINKLLDSSKLKRTESRRLILEVLLKANKPQTADEIILITGKAGPDKVTVYRTLDSMISSGLVHRAFISDGKCHFEMADKCSENQCHPHFVCTDCGRTQCMPEVSLPMASNTPAGFIINRQQVRLEGLCPKCVSRH